MPDYQCYSAEAGESEADAKRVREADHWRAAEEYARRLNASRRERLHVRVITLREVDTEVWTRWRVRMTVEPVYRADFSPA